MSNTYEIYLVSDSTGETLERIFLAIKAQFKNFNYKTHYFSFTRTENQILKIIENSAKNKNSIFLYTIVDNKLAQFLSTECNKKKIPCFGVLGDLILSFSKLLNQKASHQPSGQHALNEEYYKRRYYLPSETIGSYPIFYYSYYPFLMSIPECKNVAHDLRKHVNFVTIV